MFMVMIYCARAGPFGFQIHSSSFHRSTLFEFWLSWPMGDPMGDWKVGGREKPGIFSLSLT